MKGAILFMALLFLGIFAGISVLADEENDSDIESVEVEDIEVDGIYSEEIGESMEEIEEIEDYEKVGFVRVSRGNGWIENGEAGYILSGFWANQRFAKINRGTEDIDEVKTVRSFGRLHIVGTGVYKLVRTKSNESDKNNYTVTFYVVPVSEKKRSTINETIRDSVGELVLNKEIEYRGLTTWSGNIEFEEGKLSGNWNVKLATNTKTIKPKKALEIANLEKGRKKGFWKRLQFWENFGKKKDKMEDNSEEKSENHEDDAEELDDEKDNSELTAKEVKEIRKTKPLRDKGNALRAVEAKNDAMYSIRNTKG